MPSLGETSELGRAVPSTSLLLVDGAFLNFLLEIIELLLHIFLVLFIVFKLLDATLVIGLEHVEFFGK